MADLTVSSDVDSFMAAANAAAMRSALGLGSIATQASSAVAITGGTLAGLTGLAIRSTGAAFDLTLASDEVLTAGRTLKFNVGNTDRILTIPATGTAALLGTANVFTTTQQIQSGSDYQSFTAYLSQFYLNSTGMVFQVSSSSISNAVRCSLGALGQITWQSTNRTDAGSVDLIINRKAAATLQLGLDAAGVTNQMFTAASRITSDGVGANLTIAGGNGRGGAGGTLIFATYDTQSAGTIGSLQTRLSINTNGLITMAGSTVNTFNGVASSSALAITGTVFSGGTGTTTKPLLMVDTGTACTNWSTNGSMIGVNAPSAMSTSGLLIDLQRDNTRVFSVNGSGAVVVPSGGVTAANFTAAASSWFGWTGRTFFYSPADGVLKLENSAGTSFGRLCFGPATSGFTALKANTTTLQCRLADDSAYAAFDALSYKVGGTAGATGGTFTSITSITVVNGIITAISGT